MIETLENKLKDLEQQKSVLLEGKTELIEKSQEVKRYIRIGYLERKLERKILELQQKIDYEKKFKCHHKFIKIDNRGNQYCIKCGLSTELTKDTMECLKNREIYEQTIGNSEIINIDYICKIEVVKRICNSIILYKYPDISDEELVHFVAVAIHNMQTKKKSNNIKKNRVKRLYLRPSLLEKSNML